MSCYIEHLIEKRTLLEAVILLPDKLYRSDIKCNETNLSALVSLLAIPMGNDIGRSPHKDPKNKIQCDIVQSTEGMLQKYCLLFWQDTLCRAPVDEKIVHV